MVTYGIYNTDGKILAHGSEGIPYDCGDIAASISSGTTPFYFSSKRGRILLGTVFEVTPANRRSRPISYIEETDWVMNTPREIREADVTAFFLRAADTVEREGYVILEDHLITSYIEHLKKQKRDRQGSETATIRQKGRLSAAPRFSSQFISQTLGRILYGKTVWSTTNNLETAVAYLCAVTSSFLKVLDAFPHSLNDGFAVSIASNIVAGVDVNVFLSSSPIGAAVINLDSLEVMDENENSFYYEKSVRLVQAKNRNGTLPLEITRDSLPGWIIQQMLAARGTMIKSERERYKAFLTRESIRYDRKQFDDIDREEEGRERRKREKEERERRRREEEMKKSKASHNSSVGKKSTIPKKSNGVSVYFHCLVKNAKKMAVTIGMLVSGKKSRLFIILALCLLATGFFVFALIEAGYVPVLELNLSNMTNMTTSGVP